jgi:hypothetical protein
MRKDQAQDKANTAADKAKEALGHAGEAVSSAASAVGATADRAASAAGTGMQSLADTARRHLPHEGVMGTASKYVTDSLEAGGKYLEDKGLSGMTEDFGNLIKNHPIPAVLIGLGIGYLLGRALRS